MKRKRIPVFFAVDDNYIDFLEVTIASIIDNAKDESFAYTFYVLHNGLSKASKKKLKKLKHHRFKFSFYNVSGSLGQMENRFKLRDYYTLTTYYRLLIPNTFFLIDKAIYLDSDIVVLDDLANLYKVELGDNLVAAVPDASVAVVKEFNDYTTNALGISSKDYFNAGVLVMNLKAMRQNHLLSRVYELSKTTAFRVAQDQDLLNVLCKDKVTYLPLAWNVMPIGERCTDISLIHYNLIYKPWKRKDIMYQEHFWHYVKKLNLEESIKDRLNSITEEYLKNEEEGMANLIKLCMYEANHPENYKDCAKVCEEEDTYYSLNLERSEVYEKIKELELEGKFDVDVENDPPYTPLHAGDVDYKQKRIANKIRARIYTNYSFKYFNHQIKLGNIIIDDYVGVENLKKVKGGAIITSNHFNPFDSIPIHKAVKKYHHKRLFKIIREGNYTFPGLFGKFMRYCNSLPLASDFDVMRQMIESVGYWLDKGHMILIYPEQSMWWNYRKPKPTKPGAFRFAAKFDYPIIPTFITMRETDKFNKDGDNILAYTLHILKPIYPRADLNFKENITYLQECHDKAWKDVYEATYGVKLEYTTKVN